MAGRSRRDGKDGAYVIDLCVSGADMNHMTTLQTIVELPEVQRRAKATISDDERMSLSSLIAARPEAGVSLGGGLR